MKHLCPDMASAASVTMFLVGASHLATLFLFPSLFLPWPWTTTENRLYLHFTEDAEAHLML